MLAKAAIVLVGCAVMAPAVATMALRQKPQAGLERRVELHGPIAGFSQTRSRIEVRLAPSPQHREPVRVVVADADASAEMTVAIKPGQTYVAARLGDELASAETLVITVE